MKKYAECPPISRYDYIAWNPYVMCFTGIFFSLPRLIFTLFCMLMCYIEIHIVWMIFGNKKIKEEQNPIYCRTYSWLMKNTLKINLFFLGFRITYYKHRISNLIADYKPYQDPTKQAAYIICNHVSFLDMWFNLIYDQLPSFIAKISVSKYPIIGPVCT